MFASPGAIAFQIGPVVIRWYGVLMATAIVVGLERSHSYFLRDKEGTDDQREETHRKYTSGWLHLEAGLAHALGLDVFVICESGICSDGIFDRSWNSYVVAELATLEEESRELRDFLDHLAAWAKSRTPAAAAPARQTANSGG